MSTRLVYVPRRSENMLKVRDGSSHPQKIKCDIFGSWVPSEISPGPPLNLIGLLVSEFKERRGGWNRERKKKKEKKDEKRANRERRGDPISC